MNQKIPAKLRFGKAPETPESKELEDMLDEAYQNIAPAVNRKPDMVISDRAPTSADNGNTIGTFWLNTTVPNLYICSAKDNTVAPKTATWTTIV